MRPPCSSTISFAIASPRPNRPCERETVREVKRRFPVPSFRPGELAAGTPVDITVTLAAAGLSAETQDPPARIDMSLPLDAAQHPDRTFAAVEKAFSRMGDTDWSLGRLVVSDPERRFAVITKGLIRSGQEAGFIRTDMSVDEVFEIIEVFVNGLEERWFLSRGEQPSIQVVSDLLDDFLYRMLTSRDLA